MPFADRGSSPPSQAWRVLALRSLVMAFVLLCHLWLLLALLRPPLPWLWRPKLSTAKDRALLVEWFSRPKHHVNAVAAASIIALPRTHATPAAKATPSASVPSSMALPAEGQPTLKLGLPAPTAAPYGNSRFAHALDDAQATRLPTLPGANLRSEVPGIHVVSPPSLKHRLHALGTWLKCKDAIFKRRMTDEELIKRGLTHQQMDQKFAAECLP